MQSMTLSIQVDERKLSVLAANALGNAKNKSQFLRDAIEFYSQRTLPEKKGSNNIQSELENLKEMIRELQTQLVVIQSVQNLIANAQISNNVQLELVTDPVNTLVLEPVLDSNHEIVVNSVMTKVEEEDSNVSEDNLSSVEIPSCYDL